MSTHQLLAHAHAATLSGSLRSAGLQWWARQREDERSVARKQAHLYGRLKSKAVKHGFENEGELGIPVG